jgi:hypothetical protein
MGPDSSTSIVLSLDCDEPVSLSVSLLVNKFP